MYIHKIKNFNIINIINYIKCLFNFHKWEYNQDILQSNCSNNTIALSWKKCKHCAKCEIIYILKQ